jgi:hypothetical protein
MSLCRLWDGLDQGSRSMGRIKGIGAALQLRATTVGDLVAARGQPSEEGINMGTDRGGGAKAGVDRDLLPHPGPDVLIRVDIRAVGGQAPQAQAQVGRGQLVLNQAAFFAVRFGLVGLSRAVCGAAISLGLAGGGATRWG